MRALTIVLGVILVTLSATEASAAVCMSRGPASEGKVYSCRVLAGKTTGFGQAESKLKAKAKAWEDCGNKMIDEYIALRGDVPDDVIGDLTTACLDKECQ